MRSNRVAKNRQRPINFVTVDFVMAIPMRGPCKTRISESQRAEPRSTGQDMRGVCCRRFTIAQHALIAEQREDFAMELRGLILTLPICNERTAHATPFSLSRYTLTYELFFPLFPIRSGRRESTEPTHSNSLQRLSTVPRSRLSAPISWGSG